MISTRNFEAVYEKLLASALDDLEPQRLQLKRLMSGSFISLAFGVFFFVLLCAIRSHPWYLFFLTVVGLGMAGAFYKRVLDKAPPYIKAFKQRVIGEMIKTIDAALIYCPDEKVPVEFYDESDLYPEGYDVYQGEDYVQGRVGRTAILFSELSVMRRKNYVENADAIVLFNGLFFVADFNKNFSGRTYVWDRDEKAFNILNKDNFPFATGLEKVLLESPAFGKRFVVYSNDQVEARYILSPILMEKLSALSDSWKRNISFSFVNTKVFISIPVSFSRNLFEPGILKPPRKKTIALYYELLQMLVDIVEELNLNLRIWNKA